MDYYRPDQVVSIEDTLKRYVSQCHCSSTARDGVIADVMPGVDISLVLLTLMSLHVLLVVRRRQRAGAGGGGARAGGF